MRIYCFCLLLLLPVSGSASEQFYRCTGADGTTIFSQQPCGPDAKIEIVNDVPLHGGESGQAPTAIDQLQNYRSNVRKIDKLIGKEKTRSNPAPRQNMAACDHVASLSLRNARVRKDLMKCHSEDDVYAIYGKPRSVSKWSDRSAFDTRWTYYIRNTSTTHIFFKNGRVTRWTTHKRKH